MFIRNAGRRLAVVAASAVVASTVAGLSFGTASFAVTNGSQVPDSAVPIGTSSTGAFASGQTIEVSVPANSVLVPGTKVNILECADPDGTVANLPTSPSACDGNTIQGDTVYVNTNGSVFESSYHVYALPDTTSLGEPSGGLPVCDLSDECVLYVGENQNDFTQPHVFSQAFYVAPASGDTGTPAGNGAVQNITFTSTANPAVVGDKYKPTATGGPSGNPVVFSIDGSSSGCSLAAMVSFTAVGNWRHRRQPGGKWHVRHGCPGQPEPHLGGRLLRHHFVTTQRHPGRSLQRPAPGGHGHTAVQVEEAQQAPQGTEAVVYGVDLGNPQDQARLSGQLHHQRPGANAQDQDQPEAHRYPVVDTASELRRGRSPVAIV